MRILIVTPSKFNKGGVAKVAHNLISYCRNSKITIFSVITHSHRSKFRKIVLFISSIFIFLYYILFRDIDIIHIHVGNIISLKRKIIFIIIGKMLQKKIIFHNHGGNLIFQINRQNPYLRRKIKKLFLKIDLIICLSEILRNEFINAIPGVKCKIIPNGISIPNIYYDFNYIIKDYVEISFMGLIHKDKGLYDLIKVAKRIIENGYNVRVSIAGSGKVEKLSNLIKNNNLKEFIKYYGYLVGEQKDKFFRNSDIFVLPSYSEAMPIVILEAMAYELPIISTNVGSIPELVNNNINGYLIEAGDFDSLYYRIVDLINDPLKRKKFGKQGRIIVKEKYNNDIITNSIMDIYNLI